MTKRRRSGGEIARQNLTAHARAVLRPELGWPSAPRIPAAGVTSAPVKAADPGVDQLVAEFELRRISEEARNEKGADREIGRP
jgi:hypothetical protein